MHTSGRIDTCAQLGCISLLSLSGALPEVLPIHSLVVFLPPVWLYVRLTEASHLGLTLILDIIKACSGALRLAACFNAHTSSLSSAPCGCTLSLSELPRPSARFGKHWNVAFGRLTTQAPVSLDWCLRVVGLNLCLPARAQELKRPVHPCPRCFLLPALLRVRLSADFSLEHRNCGIAVGRDD